MYVPLWAILTTTEALNYAGRLFDVHKGNDFLTITPRHQKEKMP